MANTPIRDMTQTGTPSASSQIVFDDGVMRRGTVASMADAVRPVASLSEAQAGSDNAKTMTPLRVKDSIAAEIGVSIASKAQGDLANTALQGSSLGSGVVAFLTTPSSANLRAALTDETGTGAAVFGTSPNITTPTGIVKGDVGLGNVDNTSDATKWAATKTLTNTTYDTAGTGNSLSVAGVAVTANTGTGAVVRATSPTLVTPNLGTPSAVNLANGTALPVSGVSGLATGVAAFLATPTSANLAAALTDETGTGANVFSNAPTLVNPVVGTQTPGNNTTLAASTAFVTAAVAGSVAGVASLNGQTGALALVPPPQVRLTLTSGVAVTTSDVTGATSIYATPVGGNQAPIYDGSQFVPRSFTERTLALDPTSGHTNYHQSGKNFDLFMYWTGSAVGFGSGPTWNAGAVAGSDTSRGTGAGSTEIQWLNGVPTNKNSITLRIGASSGDTVVVSANQATCIGSFRATADGQATDSKFQRLVASVFYPAARPFVEVAEVTASWTWSTAAYRALNGNAANKAELLFSFDGGAVDVQGRNIANSSTATNRNAGMGIGINSTSVNSAQMAQSTAINNTRTEHLYANYKGNLGMGLQTIYPLEQGGGTDTQTFFGGYSHLIGMVTN